MPAGPGFLSLEGPPGDAGPFVQPAPTVYHLPSVPSDMGAAAAAAQTQGALPGDLFIDPDGTLYVLEAQGPRVTLTSIGNIAGPEGDRGAPSLVVAHDLTTDHGVPATVPFTAGDYSELALGPSLPSTMTPFPVVP